MTIAVAVACVQARPCQPGQERFGDSCYQLLTGTMTWDEGNRTCTDMGGSMAVPDSLDEHDFIWNMFTASGRSGNLWVGCSLDEEGRYVNAENGHECNYFRWAPGQPSANGEDCQHLWAGSGGLLDDTFCYLEVSIMCEFVGLPSISCLREYTGCQMAVHCLTSHSIQDLPAKVPFIMRSVFQGQPRSRSFILRHENQGELICHLSQTDNDQEHKSCFYFYDI